MRLPELTEYPISKDMLEEFKGLNKNLRTEPSQWNSQKNMTTDFYPVASPRGKRSLQQVNENISVLVDETNPNWAIVGGVKGGLYFNNTLYLLRQLKKGNNAIGCWFYANDVPLNGYGLVKEYSDKYISATSTQSPSDETTIEIIGFTKNELLDLDLKVNDIINLAYSLPEYFDEYRTEYKVTEIINNDISLEYGFICEKEEYDGTIHSTTSRNELKIYKNVQPLLENVAKFSANNTMRDVIRMGANLCVFPDGVVYETTNQNIQKIAHSEELGETKFETVIAKGDTYVSISLGSEYRYEDNAIQKYIEESALWVNQSTYLKIYVENETSSFNSFGVGDTVTITYSSVKPRDQYEQHYKIHGGIFDKTKKANVKIIQKGTESGAGYIIVNGFIAGFHGRDVGYGSYYCDETLTGVDVERKKPNIKYACECQNRIWACSEDGHEIYASALGSPYNFYDFSGLTTDSYAVNVGTDGEFTACYNYLGTPIFFKENSAHIIQGAYPTNLGQLDGGSYAVNELTNLNGVEKGSEKSLAIIDNILYYKSAVGIVAFDGSNTTVISEALGKEKYKNAVAGAYKNKYYVSMQDSNDVSHMFVYDTSLGTWCEEDNTKVELFVKANNELMFLDTNTDNAFVYSVCAEDILGNSDFAVEDNFEWECETGNFGYSYPNNKYVSRFQIRMQLTDGATASFYVQYDSSGVWERKAEITGKGTKTHLIPIIPVRCDHMKFKITGKGDAKIYSIAKIIEEGGDVV